MRTTNLKQVIWGLTAVMAFLASPHIYGQEATPKGEPAKEVTAPAPEPATQVTEPGAEPMEEVIEPSGEPMEEVVELSEEQMEEPLEPSAEPVDEKKGFKRHLPIIAYSMAMPLGSSYDFASDYSFRGISFEYRYRIMPQFSVGGVIGWNIFDDKVKGTFSRDTVTVTGTQLRWLDALTLCANMHYYLAMFKKTLPFAGLELGAYYTSRYTDMGWWAQTKDGWHFGLAPEIGTLVHAGSVSFAFSVKFKYLIETSDAPEEMFLGFNVGVGFLK
jgi:hypothetical protein